MTTDLTEQFEIQTKNARKKVQKDYWLSQYPSFINLKIDYDRADYISTMELTVTDILNTQEPPLKTHALSTRPSGNTYMIESIECPICRAKVLQNPNWPVFICECTDHPKKIYEIKEAKHDRIPKIIQLEEDDDYYD